jgi:GTP-binding protein HflX
MIDLDIESDSDSDWFEAWTESDKDLAKSCITRIRSIDPGTFFRKGKVRELQQACAAEDVDQLFINFNISPTQQRNIERAVSANGENQIRVIDRFGIILKIFSERARTKLAKM